MKKVNILWYNYLAAVGAKTPASKVFYLYMKQLSVTNNLKSFFKSNPDTLIFEGYCCNAKNVVVYNDGDNYALVAKVGKSLEVCFKSKSAVFIWKVVAKLRGTVKLCGVDPFVTQLFRARFRFNWETHCDLYVWNGKPLRYKCKCDIRPMDAAYAKKVSDGTHYHAAVADIKECLAHRPSSAVYVDGVPVCWCLLHLEKSLGMLYTEPQHRHKGYALEVMTSLCNKVIALGDVPYAYIVQDNVPSANLAAKYNLVKVKQADYFEIELN